MKVMKLMRSYLMKCINDRAHHFLELNPAKNGIVNKIKWRDVTESDMYTFLALYFFTGICKYSEMNLYWSRKEVEPGIHFFCASIMSRDRYFSIMKFLRFSEVKDVKKTVPSTRLDTFCDMLTAIARNNVDAGEHCAIDEALILYKGRLGFRQFIKSKRARFGVKMFVMCNSDKEWFGYNYNFCIYYGKCSSGRAIPEYPDAQELSKSESIVIHLAKSVLEQGRHIILDNWYSSARLAAYLDSKKTMMTGTIRPNRGLPIELRNEKLAHYESSFIRKNNSLIVKWEDKKSVHVITTCYSAGVVEKDKTYFSGARKVFNKPLQIEKYNQLMGSVDMADQLLEPYDPSRKSHAWFKKLGLHFIMRMVLNSFLAYRNIVDKKMKIRIFIENLTKQLLVTHNDNGKTVFEKYIDNNPRAGRKRLREKVVHALVPIPQKEGNKVRKPTKRCRVCYPTRKDTRTHCIGCPDGPGLCSIEHFLIYHEGKDDN